MAKSTKSTKRVMTEQAADLAQSKKYYPGGNVPPADCCESISENLEKISESQQYLGDALTEGVNVRLKKPVPPDRTDSVNDFQQQWNQLMSGGPVAALKSGGSSVKPQVDFFEYKDLVDDVLSCNPGNLGSPNLINPCDPNPANAVFSSNNDKNQFLRYAAINSSQAYSLIYYTTQVYVHSRLGLPNNILPPNGVQQYVQYVEQRVSQLAANRGNSGFLANRELIPVELIWSYWHEEGMLVQSMNAIIRRFQNIRNGNSDPLLNLEVDPLRPLSNILWGYIQQLPFRLTIQRRAYEYDHHYGLRLIGNAIPNFNPADSRSKFLEAYHNLLYKCTIYFKESDDNTITADPFPLINSLADVHRQLAEGMHNQYSELPVTSRVEMMVDQYILSRPEMAEFLRGRAMVVYDEPWMSQVDTMKTLQGWTKTSISYYYDLAQLGEEILLSIRFTPWTQSGIPSSLAGAWATALRDSIQKYIYSYQVVTGIDLSVDKVNLQRSDVGIMPSVLIAKKYQREKMYSKIR